MDRAAHDRTGRKSAAAGRLASTVALSCLLLAGCASTGQPRPPSLHLPQAVRDLKADRSGDHTDLSFTVPTLSTDRQTLAGRHGAGALTAEVCRRDPDTTVCAPLRVLPVQPGQAVQWRDDLSPALQAGPPRLLSYGVRVTNARGGSSADGKEAFAAAGAAPAPLLGLVGTTTARGVELQWQPRPPLPGETVRLVAGTNGSERILSVAGDPGGTVDAAPRVGSTITYTVARTLAVTGAAGGQVVLRGLPASITVQRGPDTFPPATPSGLVAVPVQMEGSPPEIDLSWESNSEPDLAGYLVMRAEDAAPAQFLTPTPVNAVSYRDLAVKAGHTYTYRVLAADAAANRSGPSPAATANLLPLDSTAPVPNGASTPPRR